MKLNNFDAEKLIKALDRIANVQEELVVSTGRIADALEEVVSLMEDKAEQERYKPRSSKI